MFYLESIIRNLNGHLHMKENGSYCQKTYLWTYASSEDSDQTAQMCSLIRIFTGCILESQGCNFFMLTMKTLIRLAMHRLIRVFVWRNSEGTFPYIADQIVFFCCSE